MTVGIVSDALPPLAAVVCPEGFHIDALLAEVVGELAARGLRVAGAVQQAHATAAGGLPELVLRDTLDHTETRISENRGAAARGCRLDPRGLADVAARLQSSLATRPDLLVLNRFGKAEIAGGGLRDVLSAALLAGVPVLIAVRRNSLPDWQAFHQGAAEELPPTCRAVLAWVARWRGGLEGPRAA